MLHSLSQKVQMASNICTSTFSKIVHKTSETIHKILDFVLPRNPVNKKREFRFFPLFVENMLGTSLLESSCPRSQICKDQALIAKVESVFKKLVNHCDRKDLNYEIRVMQDDDTVNAFCAPGGKVIITTGMLTALHRDIKVDVSLKQLSFDDKIAAVLGHEITHAAAGHGARTLQFALLIDLIGIAVTKILPRFLTQPKKKENGPTPLENGLDGVWRVSSFFINQHHSRCHEFEADKFGIKYAAKAGFKPEGALWIQSLFMQQKMEKSGKKEIHESSFLEFLKTHPNSDKRFAANKETIAKIHNEGMERAFA